VASFEESLLRQLDREREVRVRTQGRDGATADLPIWIVTVGGEPYVRSYRAERGAWYRRARSEGRMTLVVGGRVVPVTVQPDDGDDVNRRVSEAFTAKYGSRGPAREMVSSPVATTTLRLIPEDQH
jgi:hypothetical protein